MIYSSVIHFAPIAEISNIKLRESSLQVDTLSSYSTNALVEVRRGLSSSITNIGGAMGYRRGFVTRRPLGRSVVGGEEVKPNSGLSHLDESAGHSVALSGNANFQAAPHQISAGVTLAE